MGFSTGEASMKAIPAPGSAPRAIRRRATGTEPHSQTGKAKPPSAAPGICSANGSREIQPSEPCGRKTAIAAEARAPTKMNGSASITIDVKISRKVCAAGPRPRPRAEATIVRRTNRPRSRPKTVSETVVVCQARTSLRRAGASESSGASPVRST